MKLQDNLIIKIVKQAKTWTNLFSKVKINFFSSSKVINLEKNQ